MLARLTKTLGGLWDVRVANDCYVFNDEEQKRLFYEELIVSGYADRIVENLRHRATRMLSFALERHGGLSDSVHRSMLLTAHRHIAIALQAAYKIDRKSTR